MLSIIMLSVAFFIVMLSVIMLNFVFAEWRFAECPGAKLRPFKYKKRLVSRITTSLLLKINL